ncbi:MAG: S1C family serine protease, partial [Gallionella sp.]|nr:S1C family serine protease [Gallionella sp.]
MQKNGYSGWIVGCMGLMATLPVPAADRMPPSMQLSAQTIDRDAALADRLGGVLRHVEQADADAPVMRGVHETELFNRTAPAVVLIFSLDSNDKPNGLGSGSVIDAQGRILTNVHVIEGADRVAVVFKPQNGSVNLGDIKRADLYTAKVEKQDRTRDLALLRLERKPDTLVTLPFGSLEGLSVGADVHAIGHPEGATWTYTKGIVSQIRVNAEWSYSDDKSKHHATVIQTQTPINPGNSGGPLINDAMQMVGVNTYSRGDAQGMNYAVSVDDVKRFIAEPAHAEQPRETGKSSDAGSNPPGKA